MTIDKSKESSTVRTLSYVVISRAASRHAHSTHSAIKVWEGWLVWWPSLGRRAKAHYSS